VIPGLARFRFYRVDTLDCSSAGGELFYKFSDNILFAAGRGKNMIGYGYRSHILSYNSPPMTYAKVSFTGSKGRLSYTALFALNDDIQLVGNPEFDIFYKGYLNVNYLSYYFTDWLDAGIFEAKSFLNTVTAGYFVPISGWNTLFYKDDAIHKVKFGFSGSARILKKIMLYGQYLPKNIEYQYGAAFTHLSGKLFLFAGAEYNKFPYTHNDILQQEFFSHLNQNIGYSVEDATAELILNFTIKYGRFGFYYRYNHIYNPYETDTIYFEERYYRTFEAFAEINPSYHLQIFGRFLLRNDEKWITFGVRTNILGKYYDL